MSIRAIDYYVKNLPFDVRQEIFKRLKDVNPARVEELLEKEQNYTSFRNKGFSDDDITEALQQSSCDFGAVNNVMTDNERYPLFENPLDTYRSALQYVELLKKTKEEELIEKFGCAWEEYVPRVYKKKLDERSK